MGQWSIFSIHVPTLGGCNFYRKSNTELVEKIANSTSRKVTLTEFQNENHVCFMSIVLISHSLLLNILHRNRFIWISLFALLCYNKKLVLESF